MKLGIDIDGVVYDWEKTARFLLGWRFGYDIPQSTEWDSIEKAVKKDHWQWLWSAGVNKYGLFRHGDLIPGAIEAIVKLHHAGHEINFITATPTKAGEKESEAIQDRQDWAWFHFSKRLGANGYKLFFEKVKSKVDCDLYLDDKVENLKELTQAGKTAVCFDRGWNDVAVECAYRVFSWKGFVVLVEALDKQRTN